MLRRLAGVIAALWAGAAWADPAVPAVSQFDAARVRSAFVQGAALLATPLYKVNASRRDAPGEAEIHTRDTDIFYVLEGSALLVTGGSMPEPRKVAAEEIRGARIEGGQARRLQAGEVIVIPAGVPHWFQEVSPPFVYFVVKVTEPGPTP